MCRYKWWHCLEGMRLHTSHVLVELNDKEMKVGEEGGPVEEEEMMERCQV